MVPILSLNFLIQVYIVFSVSWLNNKISETINDKKTDISGSLKVTVELVAGLIEGDADVELDDTQKRFQQQTSFTVHGTLKKTIFATSFEGLKDLIQKLKANPDDYLAKTPQVVLSIR